ncbi:MAG: thiolase family protein [Thermodesulfobacteriota bacterium]
MDVRLEDVVIVGMGRTPRGRFGGSLRDMEADDLSASLLDGLFRKVGMSPLEVDLLFWGQTRQTGYGGNPARALAFKAGIPLERPASTINMTCISAMQAVIQGIQAIMLGDARIVVAGGMENMSGCHYILKGARWGFRSGPQTLVDDLYIPCRLTGLTMVATADRLAKEYGISRETQDLFAYESHRKAVDAQDKGWFDQEIIPVPIPQKKGPQLAFARDECVRRDTTLEALAALRPVFEGGTVTAGNACPLTDGANGIIIASRMRAEELGLQPLASFRAYHTIGVDPSIMGVGPIYAVPAALEKAGMRVGDIDLVEYNEAFACVVLAGIQSLGLDPERVNIHGGGISLGHPTGSTGSRLIVTLYHALKRTGMETGLATLCGGGGLGGAIIIRREA